MSERALVEVDGVMLDVQRWPERGAPILLLHEGLGSVTMWRNFPERLAEVTGREVVAWSRRGYGRSDPLRGPRDPDYMHAEATCAARLMQSLNLPRAHMFGHSDGASIALILASRHPERAASLTLEAPHVYVERLTRDSIARVTVEYAASGLGARLARYHDDPDRTFQDWSDIWLDPRFGDWNIEDVLPGVRAPALLIQGLQDEYGTMDQLDRIAAALTHAQRLELDQCGHSPHRDRADAVLAAAADFLRGRD